MDNLKGRFLIATPAMDDPRFTQSVMYVCDHTEAGAMALVVNQPLPMSLSRIIEGMDINITNPKLNDIPVVNGGPMQPEMGCVIHPKEGIWKSTFELGEICVTTSKDILQALAEQAGPEKAMVTLGYASWIEGQLERELEDNFWFTSYADPKVIFDLPARQRWKAALAILHIDIARLSDRIGHA